MKTLGMWLRQAREAKGETLQDIEDATRIRARFLEMLENGEFAALPGGEVQARGFLRIYARHLDLSSEEVLARYDKEVRGAGSAPPGAPAEEQPSPPAHSAAGPTVSRPRSTPAPGPLPSWISLEMLIVVAIVLIVLLAIIIGVAYVMSRETGEEEAATTPPASVTSSAEVVLPPRATSATTITLPSVAPTFPVDPQGDVTLTLEATEHVWVRVTVDGAIVLQGILIPEQPKTWIGQEAVIVETGNGAGLLVAVNGQLQGTMCGRGEVCTRSWGPDGEIAVP